MYRPKSPFTTPLILQIPAGQSTYNGVRTNTGYTDSADTVFASFKTFGGTETKVDGVLEVVETADIETWYRPDIKSNCRIKTTDGAVYEILGAPEDIEQRHQYLKFKIRRVRGGA